MNTPEKSVEEIAREIIYKTFNTRDAYVCDHCERRYDDSICETCFRIKLFEKTKDALTTERLKTEEWRKRAEELQNKQVVHFEYPDGINNSDYKAQLQSLTNKLSEAEIENDVFRQGLIVREAQLKELQAQNEIMTQGFKRLKNRIRKIDNFESHKIIDDCLSSEAIQSQLKKNEAVERVIQSLSKFKSKFEAFSRCQFQHLSKGLKEADQCWSEVTDSGMLDFTDIFEALSNLEKLK